MTSGTTAGSSLAGIYPDALEQKHTHTTRGATSLIPKADRGSGNLGDRPLPGATTHTQEERTDGGNGGSEEQLLLGHEPGSEAEETRRRGGHFSKRELQK